MIQYLYRVCIFTAHPKQKDESISCYVPARSTPEAITRALTVWMERDSYAALLEQYGDIEKVTVEQLCEES